MNENINLCEILKDCPKGTKLFSYVHGEVKLLLIDQRLAHPVIVETRARNGIEQVKTYSKEGYYDNNYYGRCVLVPSPEQPDWSKWKGPKSKFDPKTLKPFDKILVRDAYTHAWSCDIFSHSDGVDYFTISLSYFNQTIPYNEETKYLVGTTQEAPEYYRYWEE